MARAALVLGVLLLVPGAGCRRFSGGPSPDDTRGSYNRTVVDLTGTGDSSTGLMIDPSRQLLFQDPRAILNPEMTIGQLLRESARLHDPQRDPARAEKEILARVGLD